MKSAEIRGFGDIVEAVLGFLGFASYSDCGCQHRRELLNKMFPFRFRRR